MKWSATFDEQGNVILTPDTPETRRELAQTLDDFHNGRLQGDGVRVAPVSLAARENAK